ncbi:MAG: putative toxin-antitoxin system toxin component, PIN family [Planctomycetota bacterium]|nr:putative toxin-antitoxin system toxin component, PIN family [Planctomycetota bacterium]
MAERVVVDTNVMTSALISPVGANRAVLRACLSGKAQPLMGMALYLEFEDVLGREALMESSPLPPKERQELLAAFLSICEWVRVYYLWRPNLPDEGDNHLLELAMAGGAGSIITNNTRDLRAGELSFPQLRVESPTEYLTRTS